MSNQVSLVDASGSGVKDSSTMGFIPESRQAINDDCVNYTCKMLIFTQAIAMLQPRLSRKSMVL